MAMIPKEFHSKGKKCNCHSEKVFRAQSALFVQKKKLYENSFDQF